MTRHLVVVGALSFGTLSFAPLGAHAEVVQESLIPGQGDSINEDSSPTPLMKPFRTVTVWEDPDPSAAAAPAIDSHIIFMNKCTGGCPLQRSGSTSSTSVPDRSHILGVQSATLPAFSQSATTWNNVMSCMRETFAQFDIEITDVDPGTAPHNEIMFGGTPTVLGMSAGIGGVSPGTCGTISSTVVFVFDIWGSNVEDICSTAAQEVAHSWSLDHVTDRTDPMTYFSNGGARRHFKNAAVTCGSDCVNGSINGVECGGSNNQTRSCFCGGTTQNSVEEIGLLFGAGTPTPPTVKIINPKDGDTVDQGFAVGAEVTDGEGVSRVELAVDGVLKSTLTTFPYGFNAPKGLSNGMHTIEVSGVDIFGAVTKTSLKVLIGRPCTSPIDCTTATDVCVAQRCVPGPSVTGGLGTECTASTDCASLQCAATSEGSYCVEQCQLGANQCPSGFGCLDTGTGAGVCFLGYDEGGGDDGGGGCSSSGGPLGPLGLGLGLGAFVFARRKRA